MGDAAASVSALMASWLTPSSLFIFINLVIATIAITSRFATPKRQQLSPHDSPQLVRIPSLLDRVKSFDLGLYKCEPTFAETQHFEPALQNHDDSPKLVRAPSLLERVMSFNLGLHKTECSQPENDETPCPSPDNPPQPQLARAPSLLERLKSVKLCRSESTKGEKEAESPVGMPEEKMSSGEDEEGVDAKADDFINRFKQQLKLQRLDSILRYREMLKRN